MPASHRTTALLDAAEVGNTEVVIALLGHPDINVNQVDNKGETALYLAASYGHTDVVKVLLSNLDIEVNKANSNGITALQTAINRGHADVESEIQKAIRRPISPA